MDVRQATLTTLHLLLSATVAIIAVIGLFGTTATPAGTFVISTRFALLFVLPLAGTIALGLADWQLGRGAVILRAADLAAFVFAALDLSLGPTGIARLLAGAAALLAACGLAASVLVAQPRRGGFRL